MARWNEKRKKKKKKKKQERKSIFIINFLFEFFINSLSKMTKGSCFYIYSCKPVRARIFNSAVTWAERHDRDRRYNASLTTIEICKDWQEIKIKVGGLREREKKNVQDKYVIFIFDTKKSLIKPNYKHFLCFILSIVRATCHNSAVGFHHENMPI